MSKPVTIKSILAGHRPTDADEALRLGSIHAARLRCLEASLAAHRSGEKHLPAREVRALVARIGEVEVAVGLLDTWACCL